MLQFNLEEKANVDRQIHSESARAPDLNVFSDPSSQRVTSVWRRAGGVRKLLPAAFVC
jgi:hypothetical protein